MYILDDSKVFIKEAQKASFKELHLEERRHLQEWIANEPSCLGEDLLIIQKEFDGFDDTRERLDPKNGFMLSPLYDKLFDRGLMTFTDDRRIVLPNWISPKNKEHLEIKDGKFVQLLPLDEARQTYMQFHRSSVFKG